MEKMWLLDRSSQQGRLELTGKDRLDLLHRMSTNDLNSLKPGEGRPTVLTTALARIIDHVVVYERGERALMLTHQIGTVQNWLQRHIFFRDQVKLRNVSGELGQLELHGPQAAGVVETLVPGAGDLDLHRFLETPDGLLVARIVPLVSTGYVILTPEVEKLKARLLDHPGITLGDDARYEMLRIAAGLPGPGHELTEEYIPLEAGLWESVSFHKGCYIGQEIIARMESRNRLAKTLVGLALSAPAPVGAALIDDQDHHTGILTSVVQLDTGAVVGLGFVKPDRAEPGTALQVMIEGQPHLSAEVTLTVNRRQEI